MEYYHNHTTWFGIGGFALLALMCVVTAITGGRGGVSLTAPIVLIVLFFYWRSKPILTIRDDRIAFEPALLRSTKYMAASNVESIETENGGCMQWGEVWVVKGGGKEIKIPTSALDDQDQADARRRLDQLVETED